ncbi:hypothetical protein HNQ74_000842 [Bartonella doshiae]|nr:hypothetical protein [Bartonella doshiae]
MITIAKQRKAGVATKQVKFLLIILTLENKVLRTLHFKGKTILSSSLQGASYKDGYSLCR